MFYYGFRCCTIVRKIKPIVVSRSFNTSIIFLSYSKFQKILETNYIKRDFHKTSNNYAVIRLSKEEQDVIDNEKLQQMLEDPNIERTFKLLQYELEYLKHLNENVPQVMRPKDWIFLLKTNTRSQQRKYINFLFLNEVKKISNVEKRKALIEKNMGQWEEKQKSFSSGLTYGLGHNSLFMRIYDKTMDHFFNYNMVLSMLFEPKIIFDCGYEDKMTPVELNNCAKQLLLSFVANRAHRTPAHLYFCNLSKEGEIMKKLHNLIPNIHDDSFPLEFTSKSYLDLFDKDQLVYLTPHCRTQMTTYDPDKIYIIGALVDRIDPKPYSLAKAKKEGIHMEKLPLDTYLQWSSGSGKSLTLNHVTNVLLDMKYEKNWVTALQKNIPTRKIANSKYDISKKLYQKNKQYK